jgi:hypothetical protein
MGFVVKHSAGDFGILYALVAGRGKERRSNIIAYRYRRELGESAA